MMQGRKLTSFLFFILVKNYIYKTKIKQTLYGIYQIIILKISKNTGIPINRDSCHSFFDSLSAHHLSFYLGILQQTNVNLS